MTCPTCGTSDVYLSRRHGFMETRLLSWIGMLPFRCGQCWRRFYRLAPRHLRRRLRKGAGSLAAPVTSLWLRDVEVEVRIPLAGGSAHSLRARAEQFSNFGLTLALPLRLQPGTPVQIVLGRGPALPGRVELLQDSPSDLLLHLVRFDTPADSLLLADLAGRASAHP